MRIEVGGAQVTTEVAQTLEELQNNAAMTQIYLETIDDVTRFLILHIPEGDDEQLSTLSRLSNLQMIREAILSLSEPLDINDPGNDTPTACF